ncbi:MAG: hypothetical protein IKX33_03750 [Prevotella sp.]|nr:hypothetical protein [Prevotella sp.]
MTRINKIVTLWLLTICGFACHSITDILPMFWGKNIAVAATDGNIDQGMIVFMMTISFLIPTCGLLCLLTDSKAKLQRMINAILAVLIALFNVAHTFMELPSDNAGQYVILPMMIVIGIALAWCSVKYVKEG